MIDEFLNKKSLILDDEIYEEDILFMAQELLDRFDGNKIATYAKLLDLFLNCKDDEKQMVILEIGEAVNLLTNNERIIPVVN